MNKSKPPAEPRQMHDEADIGSGEKTPAHHETEEMIRQIPPLPPSGGKQDQQPPPAGQAPPRR